MTRSEWAFHQAKAGQAKAPIFNSFESLLEWVASEAQENRIPVWGYYQAPIRKIYKNSLGKIIVVMNDGETKEEIIVEPTFRKLRAELWSVPADYTLFMPHEDRFWLPENKKPK